PDAAKHTVAGDYHTHGAPLDPRRDPREATQDSGEDFSGFHAVKTITNEVTTGEEMKTGDIFEGRQDITTYRQYILNPDTYTLFLATPLGRFTLFTPAKNIIFSFSPDPRYLPSDQKVPAASYAH